MQDRPLVHRGIALEAGRHHGGGLPDCEEGKRRNKHDHHKKAGHADCAGLRQPEGQEAETFHEALLQGQRLHAEVPFDERIKEKRLF